MRCAGIERRRRKTQFLSRGEQPTVPAKSMLRDRCHDNNMWWKIASRSGFQRATLRIDKRDTLREILQAKYNVATGDSLPWQDALQSPTDFLNPSHIQILISLHKKLVDAVTTQASSGSNSCTVSRMPTIYHFQTLPRKSHQKGSWTSSYEDPAGDSTIHCQGITL